MVLSDLIARFASWLRRSSAVRDLAWLSAANVLVKPAWFVFVTAACMRVLGPAGYGVFVAAIALASVFVAVTEFGVVEYATRELSRDRSRAPDLFSNLLAGRLLLGAVSIGAGLAVAHLVGYERTPWPAVAAAGAYALGLRVNELFRGLYRAVDAFAHEAVLTLVERLATIVLGAAALVLAGTATGVLVGIAAGSALTVVVNAVWASRRHSAIVWERLRLETVRVAYAASFPIGVFALFTIVFHSAGPVLLASMVTETEAGQYGAAWRVIELYMLAPSLVTAVALPRLSERAMAPGREGFGSLVVRAALGIALGTGILAVATALLADPLVAALSGAEDFSKTVGMLRMLAMAFPLMGLSLLLSAALIASDRQWAAAATVGVAAVAHVVACVVAIPHTGGQGVAIAMVASYALAALSAGAVLVAGRRPSRTVS